MYTTCEPHLLYLTDDKSDDESDDEADQAPAVVDLSSEGDDSDEENEQGSPKRRRK